MFYRNIKTNQFVSVLKGVDVDLFGVQTLSDFLGFNGVNCSIKRDCGEGGIFVLIVTVKNIETIVHDGECFVMYDETDFYSISKEILEQNYHPATLKEVNYYNDSFSRMDTNEITGVLKSISDHLDTIARNTTNY